MNRRALLSATAAALTLGGCLRPAYRTGLLATPMSGMMIRPAPSTV
jgi:hypothetical protein